ncbi:hypothetical protein RRG08_004081 [Elysia crispata]|uniref:Uncharacterized protein n=1 Tax=Elysia crispata TaxID=231223 RepID=A0AAE0XV99_9GAST|nr:hypothetical protein RRG08_004081 [Elysia crispata]
MQQPVSSTARMGLGCLDAANQLMLNHATAASPKDFTNNLSRAMNEMIKDFKNHARLIGGVHKLAMGPTQSVWTSIPVSPSQKTLNTSMTVELRSLMLDQNPLSHPLKQSLTSMTVALNPL